MLGLLSIILVLTTVALCAVVLRDASRYSPDLLSARNFFLAGLIVFQFTSGIIGFLVVNPANPYTISNRETPALIYTVLLLLFTVGFFIVYRSGFVANTIVRHVNKRPVNVTWPKLLVLSMAFFLLAVVLRLFSGFIPYLGIYLTMFGASFLALATGLAAWAWAPRMWNPIPLVVTGIVVLGGLAVLFMDSFGRRDMLGIVLAFTWGAYYSHWRYGSFKKFVLRFLALSVLGVLFLASYTSTRYSFGIEIASLADRVKALATADFEKGIIDLFSGQEAGANSMYFIATRPEQFEYDTLHSVKLFFTLPIPRTLWYTKPDALGITSVREIDDSGKPKGWNIGPGLVGHMANDNPYLALPIYIVVFAVFFRICDGLLMKYAHDPFVVLPMGVALGQFIAVPRGELGNFFGKAILYLVGGWVAMQIVARVIQLFSPGSSMLVSQDDEGWDDRYESDFSTYADPDHDSCEAD
jgi:hypothetical protein